MSRRCIGGAKWLPVAALLAACSGTAAPPGGPAGDQLVLTGGDAVKFLHRATFGAAPVDTAAIQQIGPTRWIDQQLARPATLYVPQMLAQFPCAPEVNGEESCGVTYDVDVALTLRHNLFWNAAIGAQDQLRQRVAFALSQILVVSEIHEELADAPFMLASYHDELCRGAFGDFRSLIGTVAKNSAMGEYLGMVKNRKADPVSGTRPDENFARELMQLFTIGLSMLNPDGTLVLDGMGQPIPTYTQAEIEETARALTGWNFAGEDPPTSVLFEFLDLDRRIGPMVEWPAFHDDGPKTIVGGVPIPGGLGAQGDLDAVLDTLCNHPNVGPFIGKQLIQRLVTSNPSPAYVARISAVWEDDGSGRRGQLGAVVRAILMDPEAIAGTTSNPYFGSVREPVMRLTTFFRAFEATSFTGELAFGLAGEIKQGPLTAPSVFNFYRPDGTNQNLSAQGLVAPELKVTTHSAITAQSNTISYAVSDGMDAEPEFDWQGPLYSAAPLLAAAEAPIQLLTLVEDRLLGESLPGSVRPSVISYVGSIPIQEPGMLRGKERVQSLLSLVLHSPAYNIQK